MTTAIATDVKAVVAAAVAVAKCKLCSSKDEQREIIRNFFMQIHRQASI
jgi:hypothetical protein